MMFRIGQFSKLAKMTVKALRFYEEEGLLEPLGVDPLTGYRLYGTEQLPVAHRILALRQCGFSIQEIRSILGGADAAPLFRERRAALAALADETARRIASIDHYMGSLGEGADMKYEVVLKELPKVLVYSKRMRVASYDDYFTLIPAIGEEVKSANPGLRCVSDPAYCFIVYHDGEYRESDIDVEFCEAVERRGVDSGDIRFKVVERVPLAACVLHKGPYSSLRAAYAAVFKWVEDNGYEASGSPRESYIDGIWNRETEDEWLTEVQVPIG